MIKTPEFAIVDFIPDKGYCVILPNDSRGTYYLPNLDACWRELAIAPADFPRLHLAFTDNAMRVLSENALRDMAAYSDHTPLVPDPPKPQKSPAELRCLAKSAVLQAIVRNPAPKGGRQVCRNVEHVISTAQDGIHLRCKACALEMVAPADLTADEALELSRIIQKQYFHYARAPLQKEPALPKVEAEARAGEPKPAPRDYYALRTLAHGAYGQALRDQPFANPLCKTPESCPASRYTADIQRGGEQWLLRCNGCNLLLFLPGDLSAYEITCVQDMLRGNQHFRRG
jgi:hypothetical protein